MLLLHLVDHVVSDHITGDTLLTIDWVRVELVTCCLVMIVIVTLLWVVGFIVLSLVVALPWAPTFLCSFCHDEQMMLDLLSLHSLRAHPCWLQCCLFNLQPFDGLGECSTLTCLTWLLTGPTTPCCVDPFVDIVACKISSLFSKTVGNGGGSRFRLAPFCTNLPCQWSHWLRWCVWIVNTAATLALAMWHMPSCYLLWHFLD